MTAVYRRELRALLTSPMGWVLLSGFVTAMCMLGLFVVPQQETGTDWFGAKDLTLASFFAAFPMAAAVVLPALSMRAWSEDLRTGTWQLLATLPRTTASVVAGKYLALLTFLALMLTATAGVPALVLSAQAAEGFPVELGTAIGGYAGCLLLGGAFLAIGMFISSLTNSQTGAYVITLILCGTLVSWRQLVGLSADQGGSLMAAVVSYVSVDGHFGPISRGHLRLEGLVWYASIAWLALVLNVLSLDWRRVRG